MIKLGNVFKKLAVSWQLKIHGLSSNSFYYQNSSLAAMPTQRFRVLEGSFCLTEEETMILTRKVGAITSQYEEKKEQVLSGGGSSAIIRHTQKNKKLLARKRIELLIDRDYPMLEIGTFAGLGLDYGDISCAGIIVVIAKISGQLCIIGANDATVKGGTIYPIGVTKQLRMQEIAAHNNLPCVYLIDSGGGFLPLQSEVFNPGGRVFYNEAVMNASGVPQICLVAGSCTAGAAYIPTMANEVVMVENISSIFLAGPPLVYAALGEQVSEQVLGGTSVHCDVSGCADYKACDEFEAIEVTKNVMSALNMETLLSQSRHVEEPFYEQKDLAYLQFVRNENDCLLVPQILSRIVDGSRFHEYKPTYGVELMTGFARIDGILVGVVANCGKFTQRTCLKGCNFVNLCEARGIPLVFLQDILVGEETENTELIKQKSAFISAVATSQVPKLTVIIGKSFGAGNFAMCGRGMSPSFLFTWPNSETSIEDRETLRAVLQNEKSPGQIDHECSSYYGSGRLWDDGVILPEETRSVLSLALNACLAYKPSKNSELKNVTRM